MTLCFFFTIFRTSILGAKLCQMFLISHQWKQIMRIVAFIFKWYHYHCFENQNCSFWKYHLTMPKIFITISQVKSVNYQNFSFLCVNAKSQIIMGLLKICSYDTNFCVFLSHFKKTDFENKLQFWLLSWTGLCFGQNMWSDKLAQW